MITRAGSWRDIGVRAIAEGPRGTLWFGTEPGDLWQFTNDAPIQYHPPADWPNARVRCTIARRGR
ncbi:MAG: hypothetical protein WDM76_06640 [Limisphaerales bacterium]